MKSLTLTSTALALLLGAGIAHAQTTTTQPAQRPADCPAVGSMPEDQMPANCRTDAMQMQNNQTDTTTGQTTTDPAATTGSTTTTPSTTAESIDMQSAIMASQFIGQTVYSEANENVGEINDIIISPTNNKVVAVVGVGGFLGIGEKDVAVDMSRITTAKTDNDTLRLTMNMSRQELEAAPAFDRTRM